MEKSFVVTVKVDGKSDIGIELFESLLKSMVMVHDTSRKGWHAWLKEMSPEAVEILMENEIMQKDQTDPFNKRWWSGKELLEETLKKDKK